MDWFVADDSDLVVGLGAGSAAEENDAGFSTVSIAADLAAGGAPKSGALTAGSGAAGCDEVELLSNVRPNSCFLGFSVASSAAGAGALWKRGDPPPNKGAFAGSVAGALSVEVGLAGVKRPPEDGVCVLPKLKGDFVGADSCSFSGDFGAATASTGPGALLGLPNNELVGGCEVFESPKMLDGGAAEDEVSEELVDG